MHDRQKPPESLKRRGEFSRVFSKGRRTSCALLVLYRHVNELGYPRLGFSVSRKVGCAVTRSRIKRVLRETIRTAMPLAAGYDYVILARPPVGQLKRPNDTPTLRAALGRLLARLHS